MAELSWLSILGRAVLAALCLFALVLCLSARIRRDLRLFVKRNLALRSKLYNDYGLSLGNGSLQAFSKAHNLILDALTFPMLNAAHELGLFELLRDAPLSAQAVAERVKAENAWALAQLLQFLVSQRVFFVKDGANGEKLYYHNLSKKAVEEQSMHFDMFQSCTYRQLFSMTDSIREGDAVGLKKIFPGAASLYHAREIYPEVDKLWTPWMEHSTSVQMDPAIDSLDLSSCTHVLDWCGSIGYNSIKLCKKFPNLSATVLDLPKVVARVPETVAAAGLDAKRVQTISVDLTDSSLALPAASYDCVLMSNCVIEWAQKDLLRFFTAIKKALRPGGKLYILSMMAGSHNSGPNEAFMEYHMNRFNAYFISCADGGSCLHEKDAILRLLGEAGFAVDWRLVQVYALVSPTVVEAS